MPLFGKLKALRALQSRLLPAIRTSTDLDIILEVGAAQESNRSIGTKALFKARLGAPATISRRLERLRKLRVVEQQVAADDRRRKYLVLCAPARKRVETFARALRKLLAG
jgi:DNA-binding MarR family transcriptional regulator